MPVYPLIDSHCHLDFEAFDEDRTQVYERAAAVGISDIIIPGTERRYWARINRLCASNDNFHACYGLHPYWSKEHSEQDIEALTRYIQDHRPVAVGECGLDFRSQIITEPADKDTQCFFFEAQLELAVQQDLPVVIHSVRATETVIQVIKKFNRLRGMIHSFSGSLEQANQLIELGFYISLSGGVTYDRANKLRKVAAQIPLTSLLLETDAPEQPDENNSGKCNEPGFLINTLDTIDDLREESRQRIAEQTTANAKALFGL